METNGYNTDTYIGCLNDKHNDFLFIQHNILPAFYCLGILGNIFVICILHFISSKNMTNLLLISLAVFDVLYLALLLVEALIAKKYNTEILEEPGWFWLLSSLAVFKIPNWTPSVNSLCSLDELELVLIHQAAFKLGYWGRGTELNPRLDTDQLRSIELLEDCEWTELFGNDIDLYKDKLNLDRMIQEECGYSCETRGFEKKCFQCIGSYVRKEGRRLIHLQIAQSRMFFKSVVAEYGNIMKDWYVRHSIVFGKFRKYKLTIKEVYHYLLTVKILAKTFQLGSVLQTVLIGFFRYVAITFPFKSKKICGKKTAVVATIVCFTINIVVHVPHYTLMLTDYNTTVDVLHLTNFNLFYGYYHIFFYNCFNFFAIPFFLLSFFNVGLVKELFSKSGISPTSTEREKENWQVTKVVLTVIIVYMVSYLPLPIYMIDKWYLHNTVNQSITEQSCDGYLIVSFIIWWFPTINSSVNVLIYSAMRQSFRKDIIRLSRKLCRVLLKDNVIIILEHPVETVYYIFKPSKKIWKRQPRRAPQWLNDTFTRY